MLGLLLLLLHFVRLRNSRMDNGSLREVPMNHGCPSLLNAPDKHCLCDPHRIPCIDVDWAHEGHAQQTPYMMQVIDCHLGILVYDP